MTTGELAKILDSYAYDTPVEIRVGFDDSLEPFAVLVTLLADGVEDVVFAEESYE